MTGSGLESSELGDAKNYKRILLKLSGEALGGDGVLDSFNNKSQSYSCIDPNFITQISEDICEVYHAGYEIGIVVGGGNICRGVFMSQIGIERANADYMGMLATIINALALQGKLEEASIPTRVQSAIPMPTVAEPYIRRRAGRHMEKGRIVIFSGGTGSPFFTTDSAAVLRAIETNCDVLLKGTQVDGVYSDDPLKNPNAKRYDVVTHKQVLSQNLKFMDTAAIALASENKLPIIVFNIHEKGGLINALQHKGKISMVCS